MILASFLVSAHEAAFHASNDGLEKSLFSHDSAWHDHGESATSNHHIVLPDEHDSNHHDYKSHDHLGGTSFTNTEKTVLVRLFLTASTIMAEAVDSFQHQRYISPDCSWAGSALGISPYLRTQRLLI